VLHLSGELIQLLSIQLTSLRPLVVPLAGYLENLWVETGPTDPTRSTILEVCVVITVIIVIYNHEFFVECDPSSLEYTFP